MGITIIEQQCMGKYKERERCEDGLFVSDDFIAVIDGVTAKGDLLWEGKTSGRFAMELLKDALRNMPAGIRAWDAIVYLNDVIGMACMEHAEDLENAPWERPQAVIILYSKFYDQVWSMGDCSCRIGDRVYMPQKDVDKFLSQTRSMLNQAELLEGRTEEELLMEDTGRKLIGPCLRKQQLFANREGEFGYPVLNGCPLVKDHLVCLDVPRGEQVVLASDGYPRLCASLEESEAVLRDLIQKDPLCIREFQNTKGVAPGNISFDDRTYVRFYRPR